MDVSPCSNAAHAATPSHDGRRQGFRTAQAAGGRDCLEQSLIGGAPGKLGWSDYPCGLEAIVATAVRMQSTARGSLGNKITAHGSPPQAQSPCALPGCLCWAALRILDITWCAMFLLIILECRAFIRSQP